MREFVVFVFSDWFSIAAIFGLHQSLKMKEKNPDPSNLLASQLFPLQYI